MVRFIDEVDVRRMGGLLFAGVGVMVGSRGILELSGVKFRRMRRGRRIMIAEENIKMLRRRREITKRKRWS